uniref:ISAon1 family transposase N-terminal region protein n=1 Tax=Arachidicoccus rhizosphaerae TaxID=551991 RepID=UPI0014808104|nr:transposase [Arachidicoccus rhizosphaerae]
MDHFELKSVKEQKGGNTLEIQLEEPNVIPAEFGEGKYHSKGFYPEITIQDFPLRGHRVFLILKRRRWMKMDEEETGSNITRDWNVASEHCIFQIPFTISVFQTKKIQDVRIIKYQVRH